jgi:hypothetical protein
MDLICQTDPRRDAVRSLKGRNGLDYVEVTDEPPTLHVYFLGKLPPELSKNGPGLERYLRVEGGERITHIQILDVDPQVSPDPERDDYLVVRLDKAGDYSSYALHLSGVAGIDARYASAPFTFKIDCPSELDCQAACACEPPDLDEPQTNYLAKDYASFKQLIYDRLALLVPGWTERHVPDLGVTLVELLAYVGDYLSYYQDAVATEAYLGTARQRISVRRHARLVDYRLHEGCNARAWVHLGVSQNLTLQSDEVGFITGFNEALPVQQDVLTLDQLARVPAGAYEYFEPLLGQTGQALALYQAHNEITFYTWGRRECCLTAGATSATLLDHWVAASPGKKPDRLLKLQVNDVLIFEEVLGAKTGVAADADPKRRWAVRLSKVQAAEDPVYMVSLGDEQGHQKLPTPVLEVEWSAADALPFSLCLSAIGAAPGCALISGISVARGNVILVDHGRTLPPETLDPVPGITLDACCECEDQPADVQTQAARFRPPLAGSPLTSSEPLAQPAQPASTGLTQDPRAARPVLSLSDDTGATWSVQQDLLASASDDRDVVAEVDNEGVARLRFGNGELGRQPAVGSVFAARYRVGNGTAGNVGRETISRLVLKQTQLSGVSVVVRNPLPAQGGVDPEPIAEAKLLAPTAFRRQIERAIIASDYAELAQRHPALQRAAAKLAWTGSWNEAEVAIDPLGLEAADEALVKALDGYLHTYRRMGHDVHVQKAIYVPLLLTLEVCALPGHDRGHVKAALLARFGNRKAPDGQRGFFHPDELSFGEGIFLSRIIAAAQAVPGVECVTVTQLQRCFEASNHEILNGVLLLASFEIAQLDNDPNHPERGQLQILVRGGR